ncbi:PAS domain S-box protein [Brevibacillus sp. B_LB10_24]|uniref:PAS domain-containing sensor histidine kinase n=1 Tax=Brevibacillus sp. B_LB10_24 TaxID=3380645 RepID=UPI0038BDD399
MNGYRSYPNHSGLEEHVIIQNAPEAIVTIEASGVICSFNAAAEELFGFSANEVLGEKLSLLIPQANGDSLMHILYGPEADDPQRERMGRRKNGQMFDLGVSIRDLLFEECVYYVCIFRDITKQRIREQLMLENKERYKSLFEHHPDIVCSVDLKGTIVSINSATTRITGYSQEDVLGRSFDRLIVERDLNLAKDVFRRSIAGEQIMSELTVKHKSGRFIDLSVNSIPIMIRNRIVGLFCIARDITERKHTEELLRQSDKLSALGQLAAGVAHEIRNPLTALKGFIQLLQSTQSKNQAYLGIMLTELERINFIVNELLLLVKPQSVHFKRIDLVSLTQSVITLIQPEAILNDVSITTRVNGRIPEIEGEANQLKQVFLNILKNAIEAMPRGGEVAVTIGVHDGDKVLIQFQDQGPGIPEEHIPKLGAPFYTTKESGTGLGLMVSFKIIREHHGSIRIHSEPNRGTVIDVILPAAADGEQARN